MSPSCRRSRRAFVTALLAAFAGCSTGRDQSTTSPAATSAGPTTTESIDRSTTDTTTTATGERTPTETMTTDEETTATEIERTTDVAFRETPERTLELDLYRPSTGEDVPFVVFAHGGGWIGGDKGHRPLFDRLVEAGCAVADVQYRLAQEKQYPAAVRDVVAAVKWIRANTEEYGIDAETGALSGYSAGAHLAGLVAVAPEHGPFQPEEFHSDVPVAVDAFVGYSGPYDFTESGMGENPLVAAFFGANASAETLREGSPVTHVDGSDPPALLLHGTDDGIVPYRSTTVMAEAYRDAGVTVEVFTGDGAGHGMIDDGDWREETMPMHSEFLETHLDSG